MPVELEEIVRAPGITPERIDFLRGKKIIWTIPQIDQMILSRNVVERINSQSIEFEVDLSFNGFPRKTKWVLGLKAKTCPMTGTIQSIDLRYRPIPLPVFVGGPPQIIIHVAAFERKILIGRRPVGMRLISELKYTGLGLSFQNYSKSVGEWITIFSFDLFPPRPSAHPGMPISLANEGDVLRLHVELYLFEMSSLKEDIKLRHSDGEILRKEIIPIFGEDLGESYASEFAIVSKDLKEFTAHQGFVKAFSDVFDVYLVMKMKNGKMILDDMSSEAVNFLLTFLYTGVVLPISMDKDDELKEPLQKRFREIEEKIPFAEVLHLAKKFKLENLLKHLEGLVETSLTKGNASYLMKVCEKYDHSKAVGIVKEFLKSIQIPKENHDHDQEPDSFQQ